LGKQGFYAQVDLAQPQAYQVACNLMAVAAMTADAQEGMRAFLEKRPAQYTQLPSVT
jgi:1,4-dihydroxy-2-naphthoyl-CoA synthase